MNDLKFAIRQLLKSPGFTTAVVLVLALGIGLNTAMFSAIYALAFSPRSFPEADRVVQLFTQDKKEPANFRAFSYAAYRELREHRDLFAGVLAQIVTPVGVSEGADARRALSAFVSANYFEVLGVPLVRGRGFTATEEIPGADLPVVVVSYHYWRDSGFKSDLIGSSLRINGRLHVIIGVAPEGFIGTNATLGPEFYFPLGMFDAFAGDSGEGRRRSLAQADFFALLLVARLQTGVTSLVAQSALSGIATSLERIYPVEHKDQTFIVDSLPRFITGPTPENELPLRYIAVPPLGLTSAVLLVVSLNLAGLLLVRGYSRRKEFAIRLAVGGTRYRLVRQLLTEGLVLALIGGALGCLCSVWVSKLVVAAISSRLPFSFLPTAPAPWVLVGATLILCAVAALFFALGPALTLSRRDLVPDLQQNAADDVSDLGRRWLPRHPLVVAQIALSLALVIGAGLFARMAGRIVAADSGIDNDHTLVAEFDLSRRGHERARTLEILRTVGERIAGVPGVLSVSIADSTPYSLAGNSRSVRQAGSRPAPDARPTSAAEGLAFSATFNAIGADYFATVGRPLLRGRAFSRFETDFFGARPVAIIDGMLADLLWPGEEALGRQLEWAGRDPLVSSDPAQPERVEIVGVARTTHLQPGTKKSPGAIYVPFAQGFTGNVFFLIRATQAGETALTRLRGPIRRELQAAAPDVPFLKVQTLREHKDASLELWLLRRIATIATSFGAAAALIAVIGLYGAKAYGVSRRTREMGIRLALGAEPSRLCALILREGLVSGLLGIALGLLLGAALGRLLHNLIPFIDGFHPAVFSFAALALFAATLAASWIPARRATKVNPIVALRSE